MIRCFPGKRNLVFSVISVANFLAFFQFENSIVNQMESVDVQLWPSLESGANDMPSISLVLFVFFVVQPF